MAPSAKDGTNQSPLTDFGAADIKENIRCEILNRIAEKGLDFFNMNEILSHLYHQPTDRMVDGFRAASNVYFSSFCVLFLTAFVK